MFYLVETHPLALMLDEAGTRFAHPYFHEDRPEQFEEKGSYADPDSPFTHNSYGWAHSLGDVVNALIGAGLRLEFLHEFPYMVCDCFPFLEKQDDQRYVLKKEAKMRAPEGQSAEIPLLFSIRAAKP